MNRFRRFLKWIGQLRRLPKFVIVPSLVVLAGLAVFGGYKGMSAYNYMQNNPNFCRSCHTMETAWNKWLTSEHRSLSCHSCHETNIIQGAEQLILFSLNQPDKVSKHAVVNDDLCENCHESGNPRWRQVAETVGHRVHAEAQNIACTKCHSVKLHSFKPPKAVCSVCHEDRKMAAVAMGEVHCSSCHTFLTTKQNHLIPERQTCLACHQAQKVTKVTWPADAPMKQSCQQCHQPHEQAKPVVDCLSCHKDIRLQGLHAIKTHSAATCLTCHQPHEWVAKKRETCQTCHVNKVQHNPGITCDSCHSFKKGAAALPSATAPVKEPPAPSPPGPPAPVATVKEPPPPSLATSPDGKVLYDKYCAMCHGPKGSQLPMANLGSAQYLKQKGTAALVQATADGKGAMPGYAKDKGGTLEAQEIQAIIAYLEKGGI